MNREELYRAVGEVDEELLQRSEGEKRRLSTTRWIKWGAVAACLCLVAVLAAVLTKPGTDKPFDAPPVTSTDGVYIPRPEVTLSAGANYDMIGFFIYQGRVYTQYEWLYDDMGIVGEYLGTATGLIDEWTPEEGYVELAGSISGDFYSVKGYDPSFMLCMKSGVEPYNEICTYVCNTGITIKYGSELYEERLHLKGNFTAVEYQTNESWDLGKGELSELDKNNPVLAGFIDELYREEFILWNTVPAKEGHTLSSIYDTQTFHMCFRMNNGTTVHLRLYEKGYVRYQGVMDVCVQVSEETYNLLVEQFAQLK